MRPMLMVATLLMVIVSGSIYLLEDDAIVRGISRDQFGESLDAFCQVFEVKVDSVRFAGVHNDTMARMIVGMGMVFDVPMIDIVPIFSIESGFNPLASSIKSAAGVGQVFPPAAELFYRAGLIHLDPATSDLYDIHTNLLFSFTIYSYEYRHFQDYDRTLVAYQGGRYAATRWLRNPRKVDIDYVAAVRHEREQLYGPAGYAAISSESW